MILEIAETLLAPVFPFKRPLRLLGFTLSSPNTEQSGETAPGIHRARSSQT